MTTIKYIRHIKPKFEPGDRVRVIKATEWYDENAEGCVKSTDFDGDIKSISVSFDKGNFEDGGPWWGNKTDFIIIAKAKNDRNINTR